MIRAVHVFIYRSKLYGADQCMEKISVFSVDISTEDLGTLLMTKIGLIDHLR